MTSEEKQEYLLKYENCRIRSGRLREQLNEIRSLKADSEKLRPLSGSCSEWSDCIRQCEALERRTMEAYKRAVEEGADVRCQAERAQGCSETERTILVSRYIRGDTWEQIAGQLLYSPAYVYTLHKKALEHLELVQG